MSAFWCVERLVEFYVSLSSSSICSQVPHIVGNNQLAIIYHCVRNLVPWIVSGFIYRKNIWHNMYYHFVMILIPRTVYWVLCVVEEEPNWYIYPYSRLWFLECLLGSLSSRRIIFVICYTIMLGFDAREGSLITGFLE